MSSFNTNTAGPRVTTESIGVSLSVGSDGGVIERISGVGVFSGVRVVGIDWGVRGVPSVSAPVAPKTAAVMYASSATATASAADESPEEEVLNFESLCGLLIEACSKHPMRQRYDGYLEKYSVIRELEDLIVKEILETKPSLKAILNAIDDLELDSPSNPNFSIRQEIFGPCKSGIKALRRQCEIKAMEKAQKKTQSSLTSDL
jgi:hypothetical protein